MDHFRQYPERLARFREGDRAVLGAVYDAYLPKLRALLERGFIVKSTGLRVPPLPSEDDRADAIHQTFMLAFDREARLAYDGERDYWPYLATIARNVIVSLHRKLGRELPASDRESYENANIIDPEPDGDAAQAELDPRSLQVLQQYLASLEPRLRTLHALRYEQDLSQKDIAQRLGLSRIRVRQLLGRMLRDLARLMKDADIPKIPSHG